MSVLVSMGRGEFNADTISEQDTRRLIEFASTQEGRDTLLQVSEGEDAAGNIHEAAFLRTVTKRGEQLRMGNGSRPLAPPTAGTPMTLTDIAAPSIRRETEARERQAAEARARIVQAEARAAAMAADTNARIATDPMMSVSDATKIARDAGLPEDDVRTISESQRIRRQKARQVEVETIDAADGDRAALVDEYERKYMTPLGGLRAYAGTPAVAEYARAKVNAKLQAMGAPVRVTQAEAEALAEEIIKMETARRIQDPTRSDRVLAALDPTTIIGMATGSRTKQESLETSALYSAQGKVDDLLPNALAKFAIKKAETAMAGD